MLNRLVISISVLAFCLVLFSCTSPSQEQTMRIPSTDSSSSLESVPLPHNFTVNPKRLSILEPVFKTQPQVNRLEDLYPRIKSKVRNLTIVYNCDLDVLKVFVIQNWIPIVFLISKVGGQHLFAVTGYDDTAERIQLKNPANRTIRNLSYSEFEQEWRRGSYQECAFVTPVRISKEKVRSVLEEYLSSKQVSEVRVRIR